MPTTYRNLFDRLKSDASLVRAYTKGDASAFDMLYSRYKDTLFNSLYHQLGNISAAEEVAQEVWMAIINKAENFENRTKNDAVKTSAFRSWLFSIAHRRCADYWRHQYRKNDIEQNNDAEQTSSIDDVSDSNAAVDSQPEQQQLVYELRQTLLKLPEDQRQTFILKEEGFSYQEIADITEVGVETVKSRLRYAKKSLKEWLGSKDD